MLIRSLFAGLAASMLIVANVAAASQPTSNPPLLVEVTNTSHVCQRFDASGEEMMPPINDHPGQMFPGEPHSGVMQIPPSLQREAAPGATVTFEGLKGRFATVTAHPHETASCTSKMTGIFYRYPGGSSRVKLSFDGDAFHFVKKL